MHDWETDPRPFAEIAKAWPKLHGWTRAEAAAQLRVPPTTYNGWCAGARTPPEAMVRRLMTLIDMGLFVGVAPDWSKATPEEHEAARRHIDDMDRQADSRRDQR